MLTMLDGHDGAQRVVVGAHTVASTRDGRTSISAHDGSKPAGTEGMLAGIDNSGRAIVVRQERERVVVAAISTGDGKATVLGSYPLTAVVGTSNSPDSPFAGERAQWRLSVAVLTGAPATVVFVVSLSGGHETRLVAMNLADGALLFEQRRSGAHEDFRLPGLAAHPGAAEVAVAVERSADKVADMKPSALLLLNARTGAVVWRKEFPDEPWGARDVAVALSAQGDVLFASNRRFRQFRHADGVEVATMRAPSGFKSLVVSPDGQRAVSLWSTTPAHGFGRGGHWSCYLVLYTFGAAEPEFLGSSSDRCPTGAATFGPDGKIWAAEP